MPCPKKKAPTSAEMVASDLDNDFETDHSINSISSNNDDCESSGDTSPRSPAPTTYLDSYIDCILENTGKSKGKGKGKVKVVTKPADESTRTKSKKVQDKNDIPFPIKQTAKETTKIITYNLAIFLASEHMKELKKRTGKNTFMKVEIEEPFDTWKAQLLVHIEKTLLPDKLDLANYEVNFTVPRVSTALMAITCDEEYTDMLSCISQSKDLLCMIYVQELQQMPSSKKHNKENRPEGGDEENSEDEHKSKKPHTSRPPKNSDIGTANIPHNDNIRSLHERWTCNKKPGCSSEHCFINPLDFSHFALAHKHFDTWGAAMLKGPTLATLEMPPNHPNFDGILNNQLGQLIFNFNIPTEVIQLFRPSAIPSTPIQAAAASMPATPVQPIMPPVFQPVIVSDMLIPAPADRLPGAELSLDDFCKVYRLTDGVHNKLDENAYSGSHTFQYAEWKDLKSDAGFKAGEIAQLKHTISMWSTPRAL